MTRFSSFSRPLRTAVVGASGGIGGAFVELLVSDAAVESVHVFSRRPLPAGNKLFRGRIDYDEEASIAEAAAMVKEGGPLDLVLVATGLLHDGAALQPEKSFRSLDAGNLTRSFQINAVGPGLIAKHFLPLLARDRKAVFAALSARVGSISDNHLGGWYGYRATKAALNMMIRCMAIETGRNRKQAFCVGLHPGTVDSRLSQPFQGGVAQDKLFTPAIAASHLLAVVDGLTTGDSGKLFAWDGKEIPF
ncbi:SDR family NAD(P)-dependent oxidoreductase [Pelagibius litoralis]|uniref:SDR family NAD(P)-dependent oxidoreductase n=1 Tax=Pelagibius litoralis TaxID=374515 RepID=A0A967EYY3_9PROT|nr:SDR family NAD(P)-dependent oxidoreductase [Pelagibius litoralis]NIA69977.1 SDR family NAD(P)-dependent oxidoreductase [Pelagibius litoralis]